MRRQLTRSCKQPQHPRESTFHYRGDVLPKDHEYPDLRSRIELIVKETFNDNQSEMARAIGAGSPGTIGNWINRNEGMQSSYAFFLQDNYGWSARWILEGVLPRRKDVTDEEAEALFRQILSLPPDRRKALQLILSTD